jgi:hypothetical protein
MKRKPRKIEDSVSAGEALPDWLSEEDLILEPLEEATVDVDELDPNDLVANMEKGIRDLPVWKDLVARVGIKEARAILRRGLVINQITDGNPKN